MKTRNYKALLAGLMIAGMSACGGGGGSSNSATTPTTPQSKSVADSNNDDDIAPSIDDRSQTKFTTPRIALLGGEGVGLALSLWSATKVEKLAAILRVVDDKASMHVTNRLIDLVNARRAYDDMLKALPQEIDNAITPAMQSEFNELMTAHRNARLVNANYELALAETQNRIKFNEATPSKVAAPITGDMADMVERIAIQSNDPKLNTAEELAASKAHFEKRIAEGNLALKSIEDKITAVMKQNAKIYPSYRRYQLASSRLSRVVASLDVGFSRMFRTVLNKLVQFHGTKTQLKFNEKGGVERFTMNKARLTYITASGFIVAGIGYTLWTTLDDAESDANKLVLNIKESFEGDDKVTTEDAAELSKETK